MLFHEAFHLVFSTFSRQVLQQGRLTNYLADCGVFDTFDDRRTICLTIDHHYGVRLYTCLSHSPYKQQFDAIVAEVKQLHPTIDPLQVDYVFQSIRFAWGKIKSVRPPKPPILFAPPKKKRHRRTTPASTPYTLHPTPKKRRRRTTPAPPPYTLHPTPNPKAKRPIVRVVLYLFALVFSFCACILSNSHHGYMGAFCLLSAGICIYAIYKYLK